MRELDRVVETLRAAASVAVVSHVFPDTDSIGATLGASLALAEAGKEAGAYNASPLPPELRSLPGAADLRREIPSGRAYTCYLVLDTSNIERTGGLLEGRLAAAVILNVDHHASNTRFGDVNWVEPDASSAGEMVYRLLRRGGFPLGQAAATNLYAAILADTGSFQYGNTTPEALRTAADLVEHAAAVEDVARWLYGSRDVREWHLLSRALASLRVNGDGRVAWIEITAAAQAQAGVGLEVTEDFVNYVRAVQGVAIAIAFKEVCPGTVKVSFRSHGGLDVTGLAARFGGGGHRNAAGCTLSAELAEAKARVLAAAEAHLDSLSNRQSKI